VRDIFVKRANVSSSISPWFLDLDDISPEVSEYLGAVDSLVVSQVKDAVVIQEAFAFFLLFHHTFSVSVPLPIYVFKLGVIKGGCYSCYI
jgi:hypothetical protein